MDSMKIAVSGLNSFNRAIATTTHNIANAYTEGYTRQRADIQSNYPQHKDGIFMGSGSHVENIQRLADKFTIEQIRTLNAEQERLNTFSDLSSRIDGLLAEDNASLTPAMQAFFNAIEQLNTDPSSVQNRDVVMSEARLLTDRFNTLDQQVSMEYNDVNGRIGTEIKEINSIAKNLAELNTSIMNSQGSGSGAPPDLLDQRDLLLEQLSKHVSINAMVQDNDMVNVYAGNGIGLVIGGTAKQLHGITDENDATKLDVGVDGMNINKNIQGGRLGGLMDFRREMLNPTRRELGRLATVFASNFNAQHAKGIDLKSNPGAQFFNIDTPAILADPHNSSNAALNAKIVDANALTSSDYQIDYDGSQYTIRRLSDDQVTTTAALPVSLDGVEVTLNSGSPVTGDRFYLQPTRYGARNLSLAINNGKEIAAASPIRSIANLGNIGEATISPPQVTDAANPNLTKTAIVEFTSSSTYEIKDPSTSPPTVMSTGSYSPGGDISANGWSAQIDGLPEAGDRFTIEFNQSATADNSNGLLLSGLQFQKHVEGNSTYQESYSNLINQVGSTTRQAQIARDSKTTLLDQAIATRDAISGVNLDEEAVNLTQYKQAYEAAAKVIVASKEMFQTILNAINR